MKTTNPLRSQFGRFAIYSVIPRALPLECTLRSSSRVLRALLFIAFCNISPMVRANGIAYTVSSNDVYDEAKVVSPNTFGSEQTILAALRSFKLSRCEQQKLARLVIAPSEIDLASAVNANFPEIKSSSIPRLVTEPTLLGGEGRQRTSAQLFCLGGRATAYLKTERNITTVQIAGDHDAREWNFAGARITIVGFRLRTDLAARLSDRDRMADRVWIFAKTDVLPTPSRGNSIRDALQRMIGVITYMIVRTDPHFFNYDGPLTDVYQRVPSRTSAQDFLSARHIVCQADAPNSCELMTRPSVARIQE